MRTTKREIEAVFQRFTETVGDPAIGWELSHAPHYGGWTITTRGGAEMPFGSPPFDNGRMPAREFVAAMRFAIRALEISRGDR